MKITILIAAMSAIAISQDLKPAPGTAMLPAATNRRSFTKEEALGIWLGTKSMLLLQKEYKIDEYQKKLEPINTEQMAIVKAACRSVGVPEDKILFGSKENECGVNIGMDEKGDPIMDATGKPVPAEVWWIKKDEVKKP